MIPQTDKGTIHLIIWGALAIALACLFIGAFLDHTGHDKNVNVLYGITNFLAGGIIGLLAKTSTTPPAGTPGAPPLQTEITNTEEKSIPVTETPAPVDIAPVVVTVPAPLPTPELEVTEEQPLEPRV